MRFGRAAWLALIAITALVLLALPLTIYFLWPDGAGAIVALLHRNGVVAGALLYIEETGIPLPVPGDVFVMYATLHIQHSVPVLVGLWFGLTATVVLGSTNLYLVSRAWAPRLVGGPVAAILHLTPEQLTRAETWFGRWGPLAIIFGRHIPGLRIPITVASGLFHVPYRVFAACVGVSAAVWVAFFMSLGLLLGPHVVRFLDRHRFTYVTVPVVLVALAVGAAGYRLVQWRQTQRKQEEGDPPRRITLSRSTDSRDD